VATKDRPAPAPVDESLVITRVFDAPRSLVWKAWTEPERLVYKHGGDEDVEPVNFRVAVMFAEHAGKTRLTMQMLFPSANARDHVVKTYGAVEGMNQTLRRLEEHLANA